MKRIECTRENLEAKGLEICFHTTDDNLEKYLKMIREGALKAHREPSRFSTEKEVPNYEGCYDKNGNINYNLWTPYPRYKTEKTYYDALVVYDNGVRKELMVLPVKTRCYISRRQMYMGD